MANKAKHDVNCPLTIWLFKLARFAPELRRSLTVLH